VEARLEKKYPVEGLTICNAYYSDSTIATFIYKQINYENLLCTLALNSKIDKPVWKWSKNGQFGVKKSLYKQLCSNVIDRSLGYLWKTKIPMNQSLVVADLA
jgi:hypothetical protein